MLEPTEPLEDEPPPPPPGLDPPQNPFAPEFPCPEVALPPVPTVGEEAPTDAPPPEPPALPFTQTLYEPPPPPPTAVEVAVGVCKIEFPPSKP